MNRRRSFLLLALSVQLSALSFLAAGCATLPKAEDNTARYIAHPQFPAAVRAAPELMRDILTTTTRLERDLQLAQAKP